MSWRSQDCHKVEVNVMEVMRLSQGGGRCHGGHETVTRWR